MSLCSFIMNIIKDLQLKWLTNRDNVTLKNYKTNSAASKILDMNHDECTYFFIESKEKENNGQKRFMH